ncbi:MAG: hypothetical protein JO020_15410 [Chloroflexi bacterium]|nr:hypothetical protein [Chloroflexota bacterium]
MVICNFADPASHSARVLLDHREVVVFLHEFGHLVHSLAARNVAWVRLAQPSEPDFIEHHHSCWGNWFWTAKS